jgi:hypothetical protein
MVNGERTMNAPNFSAVLQDIRDYQAEQREAASRKRPAMSPSAEVLADDMTGALRGLWGKEEQDKTAALMLDWFQGAGYGYGDFIELLRAVAEEERDAATAALDKAIAAVAQYQADARGLDDRPYWDDFDARR